MRAGAWRPGMVPLPLLVPDRDRLGVASRGDSSGGRGPGLAGGASMRFSVVWALSLVTLLAASPATAQSSVELTIDEAVERALSQGYEVAENEAEVEAAEAAHKAAKALYGPRLMMDAKAFYFNERPTFDVDFLGSGGESGQDAPLWLDQMLGSLLPSGPMEAGEQYSLDFSLSVVQPLTKLESVAILSEVRELDVKIAKVHGTKAKVELAHQVRETAYTLLKLRASLRALEESERELDAREQQIKALRAAEMVGPEQELEIAVKRAELHQGMIKAQAFERVTEQRLALLLRLPGQPSIHLREPEGLPPLPDLAECLETALRHRPELAELRLRGDQAEAGVRAKIHDWVPDVSLVGRYQYQAGTSFGQPELAVGAVLSWTPFAWGETLHAVREAKAKARQARIAFEKVQDLIKLDVARAHAEARAQLESIDVAKTQVARAEELYRIEKARYDVQHKTATDLLSAHTSLLRARTGLSSAKYDYLIALSALDKAMGIH